MNFGSLTVEVMMKLSPSIKLALLVMLGVCSSLVTSSILAQIKKPRSTDNATKIRNSVESFKKVQADPTRLEKAPSGKKSIPEQHLIASSQFNSMDVESKHGSIAVSAEATLLDRRPTFFYVWTLSVRDASNNEVFGQNYDRQRFAMPSGPVMFNEVIAVKPGSYTVELKLWYARPDADLASLRAQRELHPDVYLANMKRIDIGK